jgi:general stress protein CsbA
VKPSNLCAETLIFDSFSFIVFLSSFFLTLFVFFDLAFYYLFYRHLFFPFFALIFSCFLAYVVSSLTYPNLLGLLLLLNLMKELLEVETVINSTCIHMRAGGLNIYMYRRRKINKEPSREIQ